MRLYCRNVSTARKNHALTQLSIPDSWQFIIILQTLYWQLIYKLEKIYVHEVKYKEHISQSWIRLNYNFMGGFIWTWSPYCVSSNINLWFKCIKISVLTLFNINHRYVGFCFRSTSQWTEVTRHLGRYTILASLCGIMSKKTWFLINSTTKT